MTDYVETRTKDGATIRIEVDSGGRGGTGFGRAAGSGDITSAATGDAYDKVLDTIRGCANGVIGTIQELDATPSAASINFAIKIDAEAGVLVAKRVDEAHFKISLSWKQAEPDSSKENGQAEQ
jgi:hypothetical protein